MRLAHARRRDLHELRARGKVADRRTSAVTHRSAQAAGQLQDHVRERALVRYATFDALGHELLGDTLALGILEVAIGAAGLHGADRSHAAIALVRTALIELDVARRLLGAREEASEHHARRTRGDRLRDVARISDAAI